MSSLSKSQRSGLEFLADKPWSAKWWGGKPHGGWPKELNARAYDKLVSLGFVVWLGARGPFDRTVKITEAGRRALSTPSQARGSAT